MNFIVTKTNPSRTSFIVQKSNYSYIKPPTQTDKPEQNKSTEKKSRKKSQLGTDSYSRSLRRAFARAKALAFFHPELTQFITFTYHQNMLDENQALKDIKYFLKQQKRNYSEKASPLLGKDKNTQNETELSTYPQVNCKNRNVVAPQTPEKTKKNLIAEPVDHVDNSTVCNKKEPFKEKHKNKTNPFKYIYVFERQKRGAIHVHMVANDAFATEMRNNRLNVKYWPHGFSEVRTINDFDGNFRPYLYLFKYMHKAERIGASFIHTSKTFDKIENVNYDDYIAKLAGENALFKEDYAFTIEQRELRITKEYYRETQESDS